MRVALFAAVVVAILTSPPLAGAQTPQEGLLKIRISSAFATLGEPVRLSFPEETLTRAGLRQGCVIQVYHDLSETRLRDGTQVLNLTELDAIERSPVNQDGSLFLYLPPGRYSVVNEGCIPIVSTSAPFSGRVANTSACCPRIEAEPKFQDLRTQSGNFVGQFQTVDVVSGQRTRITVVGLPDKEVSRRTFWFTILGVSAFLVAAIAIGSIGMWRPRWNPKSSAEDPKSLEPDPNYKPADFDDVFGDFLKKRE